MKNFIMISLSLILTLGMLGCSQTKKEVYGDAIDKSLEQTKIGIILSDPVGFKETLVKLEGEIVTECPTGCWFNIKDETGQIYIDINPSGFAIPQYIGRTVTLQGIVKNRDGTPWIHGKGVMIQ